MLFSSKVSLFHVIVCGPVVSAAALDTGCLIQVHWRYHQHYLSCSQTMLMFRLVFGTLRITFDNKQLIQAAWLLRDVISISLFDSLFFQPRSAQCFAVVSLHSFYLERPWTSSVNQWLPTNFSSPTHNLALLQFFQIKCLTNNYTHHILSHTERDKCLT